MEIYEIFTKGKSGKSHSCGMYHKEENAKNHLQFLILKNASNFNSKEEFDEEWKKTERQLWKCYCSSKTGIAVRIHNTKD